MSKIGMTLAGAALATGLVGISTAPAQAAAYTQAQVAQHASIKDCWTIIGRSVYDLTPYVPRHPGGPRAIARVCGKVGTAAFTGQHGGNTGIGRLLKTYRIGSLQR